MVLIITAVHQVKTKKRVKQNPRKKKRKKEIEKDEIKRRDRKKR